MLPRALPGSASLPPEEWLIRRVASERDELAHLLSSLKGMEVEPTSWFAPSQEAYRQRLGWVGEELSRAVEKTEALVSQLEFEQAQWRGAIAAGL